MSIPREFINDLLSRCDIVEVIDARVALRKKGSNYAACCPFHNEKTPSFTVSPSKQIYHCFGCHASGNAIGFIMEYDRLSFVEAIADLAKQLGLTVPQQVKTAASSKPQPDLYHLLEQASQYYQQQLRLNPQAIAYLKSRGLTGKIAKEFAIGYAPAEWDGLLKKLNTSNETAAQLLAAGLIIKKNDGGYYDRFRDRIMFPIRDRRGRVIAFGGRIIANGEPKYLNSPETAVFHKGNELYGIYEACLITRELPRFLVVEGYMDVVALAQHGINYAVATLGTATSAEHLQRLFRLTSEVVFCFDGDSAGQTAAWRALEIALPLLQDGWQIRFLILPESEDPDSLIRKEGLEGFNQRINEAMPLAEFLFTTMTKKVDVNSVAGKAQLAKFLVPLLNKMPENVFKHVLFERVADLVRLDVATLKILANKNNKEKITAKTTKSLKTPLKRSAMRLAIALLVQNPHLVQSLNNSEEINTLTMPGSKLLQELIGLLLQTTDLTTGALLEYWRDRPEKSQLEQLAGWEIGVPALGLEQELLGTIAKLLALQREQKADQLLQKAKISSLSEVEKVELQKLISSERNI